MWANVWSLWLDLVDKNVSTHDVPIDIYFVLMFENGSP